MPSRIPFLKDWFYHIYSRWLNKQRIFHNESDYKRFLFHLFVCSQKERQIKILSYSILPNHCHFIIKNLKEWFFISQFMCRLLWSYSKYYTVKYKKSKWVKLFESRFKSKFIKDDNYLNQCIYYVNLNPIKHWIVEDIKDRPYTSYHEIKQNHLKLNQKIADFDEDFIYEIEY